MQLQKRNRKQWCMVYGVWYSVCRFHLVQVGNWLNPLKPRSDWRALNARTHQAHANLNEALRVILCTIDNSATWRVEKGS